MTDKKTDRLTWYKDVIIYELHIKAFRDADGDGVGDFEGLMQKLDYLQELGITAIWLLPFYPSPQRDDGYDIADYYNINPAYGEKKHFTRFLREAHKRNLKVITELVINHTSDQHPWFQRARHAPKGSAHRNYYVWSDDPEQYKDVRIIFQDFEVSNWTWDPVAQQYYWHRFFHHQPDLNFDNPKVQEEVFRIIDYWCEMGVDGFRLDAVPYLFEREGTNGENLPETHAFLKKLRTHVDDHFPGTLLLAEANMWPEEAAAYFGDGDECHMNYHFPVMPRMFMALQMEDRYPITDIFDQTPTIPENCQWAIFLRNHDELTLEMVTDEERDYMYKVYVKDPKARINLGIRHRLAPLMGSNRKKIELLNYLLFSLPGTPVIYYGDEIGMGDNVYLGDRDGVRTPMQWSSAMNAGFSEANPQRLYLPLIIDPQFHYESVNVEVQSRNTSSLLWWMKRIIQARSRYKAFSRGDMKFITSENPKILAFTRSYGGQIMLVTANLSRFPQPVELDLSAYKDYQPVEVFSKIKFPQIREDTSYFLTMSAHDCQWFLLEPVRSPERSYETLPDMHMDKWVQILSREVVDELENHVLPHYLMQLRWFGGKTRNVQGLKITGHATIPPGTSPAVLLLIEVSYSSGLPEIYQLAVGFESGPLAESLKESCPQSVLANLTVDKEQGVLYDALFGKELQQTLFQRMAKGRKLYLHDSEIQFTGINVLKDHYNNQTRIRAKLLSAELSNSSITYDNKFFLKIYRKVDYTINPDLEIIRYLTEMGFPHIPRYMGAIEWKFKKDTLVLGMMQELVEHNSDGWHYMLDQLDHFNERASSGGHENMLHIPLKGTLTRPAGYTEIPEPLKEIIDGSVAERARLLGIRTGELHLALASAGNGQRDFKPEPFSLHYQRSLYASFQSAVRAAFQNLARNLKRLPQEVRAEAEEIQAIRTDILEKMKAIYRKKINVVKFRIHGDYHLGQALFTGKDFVILDFEGEPSKSYSERRLKRSPLRDVTGMIRSFHYAAYGSLFLNDQIPKADISKHIPYVEQWYHYMSGFFTKAYFNTVKDSPFLPNNEEDLQVLMQSFLLDKSIYELNYELNNRPDWVIIPLRGIRAIMDKHLETDLL